MSIRKVGSDWHFRFYARGRERTGNLGLSATEDNRARAELLCVAQRDLILRGADEARLERMRFSEAAAPFLDWCDGEYRPNTAKRYRVSFVQLAEYFGRQWVDSITAGDLDSYKGLRRGRDRVGHATLRNDLRALRSFFQYALRQRWAVKDPVAGVQVPAAPAARYRVLSVEQEDRYLQTCLRLGYQDLHDLARLMLWQGARAEELISLEQANVDLERRKADVCTRDGAGRIRTLYLKPESCATLKARMSTPGRWIFPSPKGAWNHLGAPTAQHREVLRVMRCSPGEWFVLADFQRTFALRCAQRGMPLPELGRILGVSLSTVLKYISRPAEEDVAGAMEKWG